MSRRYGAREFDLGSRRVGPGHQTFVIAEAGSNHNRDLATAHRLIDAAADADADAVKFQTFTASGLYSKHTPTMSYLTDNDLLRDGESVWELLQRAELPWEWHAELADHAGEAGLEFMSTPFEEAAVDALEDVGVPAWKIASYEIGHLPLIEHCARTGKPILLSTGMASLGDIERALDVVNGAGNERVAVMHCAINYPPQFSDLNLSAIRTLQSAFEIPVGWSDHTLGHTADVVAVSLGACIVEKHFTLDRSQDGPDHAFALEPGELAEMVKAIREAEESLGTGVKRMTESESEMYRLGRRSLVAARPIRSGVPIVGQDLAIKRPGFGIPVHERHAVIGRAPTRDVEVDEVLTWELLGTSAEDLAFDPSAG